MRHAVALAAIAAVAYLATFVLPRRTETRLARLRALIARDPAERLRFYYRYLLVGTLVMLGFAVVVAVGGGGMDTAGVGWPASAWSRLLPAAVLALVAVDAVLLVARLIGKRRDPDAFDKAKQRDRIDFLVPHSGKERAVWPLLAVVIGVMEELVYRGLFTLYAAALLGISPWWLVVPVSVAFGLGHRYQGWLGMVATGALGLGFGIFTAATGSLWPAIVAHVGVDLRVAFIRTPAPAAPSPAGGTVPPQPPPG